MFVTKGGDIMYIKAEDFAYNCPETSIESHPINSEAIARSAISVPADPSRPAVDPKPFPIIDSEKTYIKKRKIRKLRIGEMSLFYLDN